MEVRGWRLERMEDEKMRKQKDGRQKTGGQGRRSEDSILYRLAES